MRDIAIEILKIFEKNNLTIGEAISILDYVSGLLNSNSVIKIEEKR